MCKLNAETQRAASEILERGKAKAEEALGMKRLIVLFSLAMFCSALFLGAVKIGYATPITITRTFTSQTYDGYTYHIAEPEDSLFEYYNTGDGLYSTLWSYYWYGQTFTIGTTAHNVTSVKLKMYRVNSPGNVTVSIRATNATGYPTGSDLTSGVIDGNTFTTDSSGLWYQINVIEYALSAATKYAIIANAKDATGANYARWRIDQISPTYTGGSWGQSVDSGVSWTLGIDKDFMFEIWGPNSPYVDARTSNVATAGYSDSMTSRVGQRYYGAVQYRVDRSFPYFDTSILPDNITITSVVLGLCIQGNYSTTDFNVTIQNGQPSHPDTPFTLYDYNYLYYSGDGGSRNTSSITSLDYWNITLSATGLSWIQVDGMTKLCLRSSKDIAGVAPTGDEYITFWSAEQGLAYSPKLYVTYEAEGYHYVVHGPYLEDNGLAYNGIVNVTIAFQNVDPISFALNGSSGTAETYDFNSTDRATLMNWNITTDYVHSRVYAFRDGSFDEVWLYIPNLENVILQYTITITDFAGLTNATVEVDKNVQGYNRIVERQNFDVYNGATFWLTMYSQYTLKVVSDQGTFTWGLTADGIQSKTYIVSADMIPYEYSGENATISCTRNATLITVLYSEARTEWINTTVYLVDSAGYHYVTHQLDSGTTQNYTVAVSASSDYLVTISALQNGEVLSWQFALPKPPGTTNIWTGIWEMFGIWPFNPANAVGMFIVLLFFCVGSWADTEFFLGAGIIIAALLTYLGWMNTPWLGISTCLMVVFLMYIHKGKQEIREL